MDIDEIIRRVREEAERRRKRSEPEPFWETPQPVSKLVTREDSEAAERALDRFLWRYGMKYRGIIKKIPILNGIARREHSKLACRLIYSKPIRQDWVSNPLEIDALPNYINYHGFLIDVRREGFKGKVKLFLFKFFRFFAWWQEQINRALYQELMSQRAKMAESERWFREFQKDHMNLLSEERAKRDEAVKIIDEHLIRLDQIGKEAFQQIYDQNIRIEERERRVQREFIAKIDNLRNELVERDNLDRRMDEIRGELKQRDMLISNLKNKIAQYEDVHKRLRSELILQKEKFDKVTKESHNLISQKLVQLKEELADIYNKKLIDAKKLPDALYAAFEDRFRGGKDDIKDRLGAYLPYIKQVNMGTENFLILDVGCGRGEWLELLREEGYTAKGVEINKVMVDMCRQRGLDVVEANAIDYLRSQKPSSIGAITGFHFVEHLSLRELILFFDECLRVLVPHGMVIFETPNPENLIVGAYTFHFDPTHQFLLTPESLSFIAQQKGFTNTSILRLHKYSDFNPIDEEADAFKNKWFYSETDFALIGYKP